MLFNSFEFVYLFIITFILFYIPFFKRAQVIILIAASFFFYAYSHPILLLLLISSVIINILSSYWVINSPPKYRRLISISGVSGNLLILAFFKYSPLVGRTFFPEFSDIGQWLIGIPLPIGISFFTFQGISLVVDTFRSENIKEYKNLISKKFYQHSLNTAFFISFFPQLVAGPIVKAHEFIPQIKTKLFSQINWEKCFRAIVTGYFLKMVIADNLKDFTFWMAYPYFISKSSLSLVTYLYGFSIQIFADFAGYSLIAIGLAGLFGYQLKENFNFPYISTSFSEFWRRWHISLSSFLKEYLYFPLGGNKKGAYRTYINLMITMFLGGLWHGAAWSYAVWGSFHGIALAIERLFKDNFKIKKNRFITILNGIVIFIFVTFAWLLFQLPEFNQVIIYIQSIYQNTGLNSSGISITYIILYSLPVIAYHLYYLYKTSTEKNHIYKFEPIIYGLMVFMILTNSGSSSKFIYFQF